MDFDSRLQALVECVDCVGGVHAGYEVVLFATDRRQQHSLSIDGDLELVFKLEPANCTEIGFNQFHPDEVLAIEWERVLSGHAAARAERHAFEMSGLRDVAANAIGFRTGGYL